MNVDSVMNTIAISYFIYTIKLNLIADAMLVR